jgi:hypothetical protein
MRLARGLFLFAAALAVSLGLAPHAGFAAGNVILFIEIGRDNLEPRKPVSAVNTLNDLSRALSDCWSPPPFDRDFGPVDVNFTMAFRRSGELFGTRIVTFVQKVTPEIRERYNTAVAEAVDRCARMPFTAAMGGAVAGTVFRVSFLDKRNSKKADASWPTTTTS